MRLRDEGFGDVAVDAGQTDVEPATDEEASSATFRSTSASIAISAGNTTFLLRAATAIALSKQADRPAASNCSGLVPIRGDPGVANLMSNRPSELREAPFSRPPVVWVLAVCMNSCDRSHGAYPQVFIPFEHDEPKIRTLANGSDVHARITSWQRRRQPERRLAALPAAGCAQCLR